MTQPLRILTELDAVNYMLFAVGETPVSSLEDTGLGDAVMARTALRNTSRRVQSTGWKWNTLREFTLSPTSPLPGRIAVPPNTLYVDSAGSDAGKWDIVLSADESGLCLENTAAGEFALTFSEAIKCDLVLLKEFEQIPSAARDYITAVAAREFQQSVLGSSDMSRLQGIGEAQALATLNKHEARSRDSNMFRDNHGMSRFRRYRR